MTRTNINNINNIKAQPCMFLDVNTQYIICNTEGVIERMFTSLESAKYMLTLSNNCGKIYEAIVYKNKIMSVLGEI